MEYTSENLEQTNELDERVQEKTQCVERPLFHRILSWVLIAVVLFAFLGTCHFLATYGRI